MEQKKKVPISVRIKRFLPQVVLLVLVFFHIYPQAMYFHSLHLSCLSLLGFLGVAYYFIQKSNYSELIQFFKGYIPMVVWILISAMQNSTTQYFFLPRDLFLFATFKSLIGWAFSAYLIVQIYNKLHPKGNIHTLFYYFILAVSIQGVIAILMYRNPAIDAFFQQFMLQDDALIELKRSATEGKRLLGWGTAFFGMGIICGLTLILIVFVLVTKRTSKLERILLSVLYAFVLYYGMLSARTTMIGAAGSVVLMVVLIRSSKTRTIATRQIFFVLGIVSLVISVGYTLCYYYFPDFADWAFEAFINYSQTGELRTASSDGIAYMWRFPFTTLGWIFGNSLSYFQGSDIGYSRLLLFFGVPGTFLYFWYQYRLMRLSVTKYSALNWLLVVVFIYNLSLNIKGLSSLDYFSFMVFFYLLNYKYVVLKKQRQVLYPSSVSNYGYGRGGFLPPPIPSSYQNHHTE
jgi:hypothetical protein